MKIYPKINSNLIGLEPLKEKIEKYRGVEIQFFHEDGIWGKYNIVSAVENLMEKIPTLEEITIHPPLTDYDIEFVIFNDINLIKEKIHQATKLAKKYNIKINLLYHVGWPISMMEQGPLEKIKRLIKLVENTKVKILLENIYSIDEFFKCTPLEICKKINSENLKMCLDICHLHCEANMYKCKDFEGFLENYLEKEYAHQYIYQIHFSSTKDNDGYIEHKTHGRKHDSLKEFEEDFNILKKYDLTCKNIITEVSEENYYERKDQLSEIELLETKQYQEK